MKAIRTHARTNYLSMGRAASELIRRGACCQLATRKLNGLPVFDAPEDFPAISTERVRELLDEAGFRS
jgi:hypothetical protein